MDDYYRSYGCCVLALTQTGSRFMSRFLSGVGIFLQNTLQQQNSDGIIDKLKKTRLWIFQRVPGTGL